MIGAAALILSICPLADGGSNDDIPELYITEIQTTGTADEWVELVNTADHPIHPGDYALTTDDSGRAPSSWFGDYQNLSGIGPSVLFENITFYLNAEDLYEDIYYAPSDDPLDQFYLLRVWEHNEWGTYYHLGPSITVWWNGEDGEFINETEKNLMPKERLEDHIYQVTLPSGFFHRYVYVSLDPDDPDKYETDQIVSDNQPNPINGTDPLILDLFNADWTEETRELVDYLLDEHNITIQTSELGDLYARSDLHNGTHLNLTADDDDSFLRVVNITTSPHFWTMSSLPRDGLFFVNDNQPDTIFYYDQKTANQVFGPGQYIVEIDLTNEEHFTHHSGQSFYNEPVSVIGSEGLIVDFTDPDIASQITTVHIQSPILYGLIYANKNTGAITSGTGDDIVEITMPTEGWVDDLLFPIGSTYHDYTKPGAPIRNLPSLIVVDDHESDPDQNRNELVANGRLYLWNNVTKEYVGPPAGWGTNGPAPECAGGWSCQAYFDGEQYHWGSNWTLGEESPLVHNSVSPPNYGSSDVVINEINPSFVELYNRGDQMISLTGWKLTYEGGAFTMSGWLPPGEFFVIPESDLHIHFTPGTGGRFSLFNELGVLTSSIGFQTDVSGNQQSYCARHIDGMGPDYGYNDSMITPWAYGVEGAQKNADWGINVDRTTDSENYKGLTFLQIGTVKDSPWSLVENLSNYNSAWADGSIGVKKIDQIYINNFDVVFCLSGLSPSNQWILDDYVNGGGRLYVEYGDWNSLAGRDFYRSIGLSAASASGTVSALTGFAPVTEGVQLTYSGTVSSKFTPNSETFRVLEEGGNTYAVLYVDIDTSNPANSYRAVASSVKYEKMSEMTRSVPYEFIGAIVDYFLMSDDEINHAPVVELKDPLPDPEVPLYKARPTLLWQNKDIDVWDQVPGTLEYTLYIDTNQNKVVNMDPDAHSAVFVQEGATATMVHALDAPVAGIYYWGIFAEDKYWKTTYEYGGAFKFDNEKPYINSMTAMKGDFYDDPLYHNGNPRIFSNSFDNIGSNFRPDKFVIEMGDNLGLKFSNNDNVAIQLFTDEYLPPATAFSVKVLFYYEGPYEDDLPNFKLTVDKNGTNNDLESLTGLQEATFYMVPDREIPDGNYTFYLQAADTVRWGSHLKFSISIDFSGPDTPYFMTISPKDHVAPLGEVFIREGYPHLLSISADMKDDISSMDRVEFQQAATDGPEAQWLTIGTDHNTLDNRFTVTWHPDREYPFLRAIAFDQRDHYSISDVYSDFTIDGKGPMAPIELYAELDFGNSTVAIIEGQIYDQNEAGEPSGVDHVILYHWNSVDGTMESIRGGDGKPLPIHVGDNSFQYSFPLQQISAATGDLSYAFYSMGVDNVGNVGAMSDMANWTNTGRAEPLRIINMELMPSIPLTEPDTSIDDSLDELRSISVTFLESEPDSNNHFLSLRNGTLNNANHASDLGLGPNTKFLRGYYDLEVSPGLPTFVARCTIEFHISSRSQLGTKTAEILHNLRLVTRKGDAYPWTMVDLVGGQVQPVDEAKGLYRVQAGITTFGKFAIVVSQCDLTITEIDIPDDELESRETVNISVTVHNSGAFPHDANNVKVKVFCIDPSGNQEYIGEIDYGTIDPEFSQYPDLYSDTHGSATRFLSWKIPPLEEDKNHIRTIRAQVDPDGYVREISETNNEATLIITATSPITPPWMNITGPEQGAKVKGLVHFHGSAFDNYVIHHFEYRIDRVGTWKKLDIFMLPSNDPEYPQWDMFFASAQLPDGQYTFQFRAHDGNQYSEVHSVDVIIDNSESDDLPGGVSFPPLISVLLTVLIIILGILIFVVHAPGSFTNSGAPGRDAAPPSESTGKNSAAMIPEQPSLENCISCGSRLPIASGPRPIGFTCPTCGHQNVSSIFNPPT